MEKSLAEVARAIGGELVGDPEIRISGIAGLEDAREGQLAFLANPKYLPLLDKTLASAVITGPDVRSRTKNLIHSLNPSTAFSKAAALFVTGQYSRIQGIHPSAVIGTDVRLGAEVSIGPHVVIENEVSIGSRSVINAGSFVGCGSSVGDDCVIYPNVTISHQTRIGDRVVIHSGTVIGSDGFGYEWIDGKHQKIPQIGNVVIEDDVEIGANVTVDRARFNQTRIGRGTKIDNLVQIAHNVIIGENCIIVAQVAISGSTRLEDGVILAGQVGVAGHLTIGKNAVVGAQSGVSKSLPGHQSYFGYPAKPMAQAKRLQAAQARLTRYIDQIFQLQRRIEEIERKLFPNES